MVTMVTMETMETSQGNESTSAKLRTSPLISGRSKSNISPVVTSSTRKMPPEALAVPKKSEEDMDELDLIVCHEEFHSLVALVEKVKHVQDLLQRAAPSAMEFYETNKPPVPKSCLGADEVLAVVERMREQLSFTDVIIRRGSYPVTDAMMDDNFTILQSELEFCETCLRNSYAEAGRMLYQRPIVTTPTAQGMPHAAPSPTPQRRTPTTSSSSTKYSKWQSDILLQWLVDHHKDPTLSKYQARELAQRTGLKPSQVSTWLQNMRRRRKKNTIEGTKKATHFLDFLFLANERDKNGGVLPQQVDIQGLRPIIQQQTSRGYETPTRKRSYASSSSFDNYPAKNFVPFTPPVTTVFGAATVAVSGVPPFPGDTPSQQMGQQPEATGSSSGSVTGSSFKSILCKEDAFDGDDMSFAQGSLFDGLQTVTESFDDSSIEPAPIEVEIDEDLLYVFADTWQDITPDRNMTTHPMEQSQSCRQTSASKGWVASLDPSLKDIELMEWDDVDVSPISIFRKKIVATMVDGDVEDVMNAAEKQALKEEPEF